MNTFVKNYWSLYLDFLDDFEELDYKGLSLPYLFCHFYSIVKNNKILWNQLYDESFEKGLKNKVKDQTEIQRKFNTYIQLHTKAPLVKNNKGRVVVHVDKLLRFPNKTFTDYFDPLDTIIISSARSKPNNKKIKSTANKMNTKKAKIITNTFTRTKKTAPKEKVTTVRGINKIPIKYFHNYAIDTEKAVKQVQNKAREIYKAYKKHPLYSDEQFQNTFLTQLSEIINCIEESNNFLKKVPVSCIVVSTTHSFINRILAVVASEKGVPTVCMQHGIIANEFGYLPKIAKIDAVYGNFEVDWYKRMGASVESLEIIGHPRFDELFTRNTISRDKFNQQLGLDTNKKTLMVTVRENYDLDKWRILIKTILNKYKMNIVIKDYPGKETNVLLKEFPLVYSTKTYHLYDILPNVDAVVAYPSTVGLEAMLAGKPVFILDNTGSVYSGLNKKHESLSSVSSLINNPGYSSYYNGLDEMVQNNPEKLGALIVKYFNDANWERETKKKRDKFLTDVYPDLTLSGKRLKKLIIKLTG